MACEECKCQDQLDLENSLVETKPFKEFKPLVFVPNIVIRSFNPKKTQWYEYKWHIDEEDRLIYKIWPKKSKWKFQFDNQLPIPFKGKIKIPKNVYHRIIPGDQTIFLLIIKKKS